MRTLDRNSRNDYKDQIIAMTISPIIAMTIKEGLSENNETYLNSSCVINAQTRPCVIDAQANEVDLKYNETPTHCSGLREVRPELGVWANQLLHRSVWANQLLH
jgi:hypothetical protein